MSNAINMIFVINIGSVSKKYALYQNDERRFFAHLEAGDGAYLLTIEHAGKTEKKSLSTEDYANGLNIVIGELSARSLITRLETDVAGIGFRVVAPGDDFLKHSLIDEAYLRKLEGAKERAPLHSTPMLAELHLLRKMRGAVPIIGVSDSAFHRTMPEVASAYAIKKEDAEKLGIKKFGYHGISCASVAGKLAGLLGTMPSRAIICHLGGGVSITALRDGKSIDTSMGMTPLSGAVMATRSGDIDPGAILAFLREGELTVSEAEDYLNHSSGLLGISGKTGDVRELLALETSGDERAKRALLAFAYSVKKYIGAYTAVLGGLDALIFSATIGERSAPMRSRILAGLTDFGITLDEAKNTETAGKDGIISLPGARVLVAVVCTDEMSEIARETQNVL